MGKAATKKMGVESISLRGINSQNLSAGTLSALICVTGPPVIILEAAANGNFTNEQTISWMFSVMFFGGLLSIIMPFIYKIPIVGGHSITAVAFIATMTSQVPYSELIGSYLISSLFILVLGVFGLFGKLMKYVPREIISAMMAGLIISYVVRLITSIEQLPLVGGVTLFVFLLFTKMKTRIPPVVASIIAGFIVLFFTNDFQMLESGLSFVLPQIQKPTFQMINVITISLPIALLILSNDSAPSIGALEQKDFRPPVNRILTFSGIFSIMANLFGGQSANSAGMMSAICSSDDAGLRDKRYIGAVFSGVLVLLFGIFSWKVVPFIQSLPGAFIAMLAGLSLIGMLGSSMKQAFSKPNMLLSTTLTMVISMSSVQFFYVSAPVWALVIGAVVANFIESKN